MPALKLSEHFDGLISDLDLKVEILIRDKIHDEELVSSNNRAKDEFIREIRECERVNMVALRKRQQTTSAKDHLVVKDEELFTSYCFFIETEKEEKSEVHWNRVVGGIGFRLVVVDCYVTNEQISCFHEILKFTPCHFYGGRDRDKGKEKFFYLNSEVNRIFYTRTHFFPVFKLWITWSTWSIWT
jgi:hypothetical protein